MSNWNTYSDWMNPSGVSIWTNQPVLLGGPALHFGRKNNLNFKIHFPSLLKPTWRTWLTYYWKAKTLSMKTNHSYKSNSGLFLTSLEALYIGLRVTRSMRCKIPYSENQKEKIALRDDKLQAVKCQRIMAMKTPYGGVKRCARLLYLHPT